MIKNNFESIWDSHLGENLIEFKLGKMPCFLVGKDDTPSDESNKQ